MVPQVRSHRRTTSRAGAVLLLGALGLAQPQLAAGQCLTTNSTTPNGWEISNFDNATMTATGTAATTSGTDGNYGAGPGTPPLGAGSFHQRIGSDGDDAQRIRTSNFNGVALADIVASGGALSYSTYASSFMGCQVTYIQMFLSNGDILFFEPCYQTGAYSGDPVPNQGSPVLNTWQTWDARLGGWWSLNAATFGPPLVTLANYAAANPGVTLRTTTTSFRLTAGFGAGAWPGFDGAVDRVVLQTATLIACYDFEADVPVAVEQVKWGTVKNLYR